MSDFVRQYGTEAAFTASDSWVILSPIEQSIKRKIEAAGVPLKDWDINIYRGVLTGYNEAFIISTEKRNEILANCKTPEEHKRTEELIRPILRGRDIKRYGYDWAGLWLIWVPWHFPLHLDSSIKGASQKAEEAFKAQYPAVYEHLYQYKDKLAARNKAETGIRYEWYALQRWVPTIGTIFLSSLRTFSMTPGLSAVFRTMRSLRSMAISWAVFGLYLPVLVRLRFSSRLIVDALIFFCGGRVPRSFAASHSIRLSSSAMSCSFELFWRMEKIVYLCAWVSCLYIGNANITDPGETSISLFLFLALPVGEVTFFNAKATDSGGGGGGVFMNPHPPRIRILGCPGKIWGVGRGSLLVFYNLRIRLKHPIFCTSFWNLHTKR